MGITLTLNIFRAVHEQWQPCCLRGAGQLAAAPCSVQGFVEHSLGS